MTKRPNRADRLDPLIRDALAWIVFLKSGEATLDDAEHLVDWRGKSAAHERAFRDAVKCWRAIGRGLVNDHTAGPGGRRRKTNGTGLT